MNRKEQVEEIAKFICESDETCEQCLESCNKRHLIVPCWIQGIAENIYNADYHKASEIAREIIDVIESTIEYFYPTSWHKGYHDAQLDIIRFLKKKYMGVDEDDGI